MATDYAQLAKRISSVTTKCLLTAIVLVAGLGFGSQVLRWWASGVSEPVAMLRPTRIADGLGDPWRLHILQFGDQPWSLRRQSIAGDRRAAMAALRASCREIVRQDHLPDDQPGEAETEFLAQMASRDPIEQEPGKWRLYELGGAFPVVVGTRPAAAENDPAERKALANVNHRVVTWGLVTPTERDIWTLHTFQPEPTAAQSSGIFDIPPPPGCSKILSMRVVGGGSITALEGPRDAEIWIDFYDQWFKAHNWEAAVAWRQSGSAWHGRFSTSDPDGGGTVDIHFTANNQDRFSGLLLITPTPSGQGPR